MKQIPRFIYASNVTPNLTSNKIYKVSILEPNITTIVDDNNKTMIVNLEHITTIIGNSGVILQRTDANGIRWILSKLTI